MTQPPIDDQPKATGTPIDHSQWNLIAESGWMVGQHFAIAGAVVLGREVGCDIVIPGTHLSRRHARLLCRGASLTINDLGSANGTFVNEQRVNEGELKHGDTVRFDVLTFRVQAPRVVSYDNATIIRPSPNKKKPANAPAPKPPAANTPRRGSSDRSKVRTTSHTGAAAPASSKPPFSLLSALAAIVVLVILASIGYLVSQL